MKRIMWYALVSIGSVAVFLLLFTILKGSGFERDANLFFRTAFVNSTQVVRSKVDWPFALGDSGGIWELKIMAGLADCFQADFLQPGYFEEDRLNFIRVISGEWPGISMSELFEYDFYRGEFSWPNGNICHEGTHCNYYVLRGPDRIFVSISDI